MEVGEVTSHAEDGELVDEVVEAGEICLDLVGAPDARDLDMASCLLHLEGAELLQHDGINPRPGRRQSEQSQQTAQAEQTAAIHPDQAFSTVTVRGITPVLESYLLGKGDIRAPRGRWRV